MDANPGCHATLRTTLRTTPCITPIQSPLWTRVRVAQSVRCYVLAFLPIFRHAYTPPLSLYDLWCILHPATSFWLTPHQLDVKRCRVQKKKFMLILKNNTVAMNISIEQY